MMNLDTKAIRLCKLFLALLLAVAYVLGSYASFRTNHTWDTEQEQETLRFNMNAVTGLLHGNRQPYRMLLEYQDRYYGVGFHAPAYVVQKLLYKPVARFLAIDPFTAFLQVKQWFNFTVYFLSGILFFFLARRIAGPGLFPHFVTTGYLLWPYLFGQALIDVKDVPFMFAWLACTCLSFSMIDRCSEGNGIDRMRVFFLAVLTGWLLSIRIAGVLIAVQYVLTLLFVWVSLRREGRSVPRGMPVALCLFAMTAASFVFIAYPVLWFDPLQAMKAIAFMRQHPFAGISCTLTFGECMRSFLSPSYIPAWLAVKLPVMVIAGYVVLPLVFLRVLRGHVSGACAADGMRTFGILSGTSLAIPALLIFADTVLYNEVRQVMFLLPLYFLVGVSALYFLSRRIAVVWLIASIAIFVADNLMAFPYQYVWFNEVARQFKVENHFATDYWGASGKNLARRLEQSGATSGMAFNCVYADTDLIVRHFVSDRTHACLRTLDDIKPGTPRSFLILSYTRDGVLSYPENCAVIGSEKLRLLGGNGDIHLAYIRACT